jgi:hypothetical protein
MVALIWIQCLDRVIGGVLVQDSRRCRHFCEKIENDNQFIYFLNKKYC